MKILSIDTSGQQAVAAIINDYIVIGEIMLNAKTGEKSWTHSEILMPGVKALFDLAAMEITDMDYIAYAAGPGSFTGLRIGASSALGLAQGINKPAVPVPTLDMLAYNMLGAKANGLVVPMMDARRGQVYTAIYEAQPDGSLTRTTDYLAITIEAVAEMVKGKSPTLLGDGVSANMEALEKLIPDGIFAQANNNRQRGLSLAICALEKINNGYTPEEKIDLLYVRAPQAVRDLKAKDLAK